MFTRIFAAFAVLVAVGLGGCSDSVDGFNDRMIEQNTQLHDLMNKETLLNVVRASRHEALDFLALSQTNGNRTQDLKIGLPNLTLGPAQTSAERQFVFSGNILDNSVTGSFQTSPLITTQFQQGMMTPLSQRQLAMLIAAHGREAVLLAAIEEIRVSDKIWVIPGVDFKDDSMRRKKVDSFLGKFLGKPTDPVPDSTSSHTFNNDPSDNEIDGTSSTCSAAQYLPVEGKDPWKFEDDSSYVNAVLAKITYQPSGDAQAIGDKRKCSFARFRALLTAFLRVGLTIDVQEVDAPAPLGSNNSPLPPPGNALPPPGSNSPSPGKFCLDGSLVDPPIQRIRESTIWRAFGRCEFTPTEQQRSTKVPSFRDQDPHKNIEWFAISDVSIRLRSPVGMYNYLGKVMRLYNGQTGPAGLFGYSTHDGKTNYGLTQNSPFLTVYADRKNCAVLVEDRDQTYCVKQDDVSTLNLLAMLQDLRNLNTSPSDLGSSFTVRVAP